MGGYSPGDGIFEQMRAQTELASRQIRAAELENAQSRLGAAAGLQGGQALRDLSDHRRLHEEIRYLESMCSPSEEVVVDHCHNTLQKRAYIKAKPPRGFGSAKIKAEGSKLDFDGPSSKPKTVIQELQSEIDDWIKDIKL
jgi:hypothetical protein